MKFRKDGKLYIHKSDIYYVFAYNLDAPECLANALGSVREALSFNEEVDNEATVCSSLDGFSLKISRPIPSGVSSLYYSN